MAPARVDEAELERLLKQAGSTYGAAEAREVVRGVLAAPEPLDPDRWMILVADAPDRKLLDRLRRLKEELRAELQDGTASCKARLRALRDQLSQQNLDGFVVPRADEHQGEYVPARALRLAWLTGFTGSAGQAVVLGGHAAIFVDGRYTLQVRNEVDTETFEPKHLTDEPPEDWIAKTLAEGGRLGYDPWLHTRDQVRRLEKAARRAGGAVVAVDRNPLDAVWQGQPPPPLSPAVPHDVTFTGSTAREKRERLAEGLKEAGIDTAVITLPDSIAWLLNVRGGDVPHTPLVLSFAFLNADGSVDWFVDRRKLVPGLETHLGEGVRRRDPDAFVEALADLGAAGARVRVDPATAPAKVFELLESGDAIVDEGADPCVLPKASKTAAEITGARRAHQRDGAAVTRFLAWLAAEVPARAAGDNRGPVTELEAAERLFELRRETGELCDLSFDTISGAGPNGAIVHYRVSVETSRPLGLGELYLVDSGGQYPDGTTDITRTVAIGEPDAEMRERYTRVLKGHIAVATARFPKGTTGSQLDPVARYPLWQAGLDYDHGTGHGVGSFLAVHEGPQRISKVANKVALAPGMIVSNEPGYYKEGAYGIRVENLVTVIESEDQANDERPMLAFETLSLAPYDRNLIDPALLTAGEIAWVNAYHHRVNAEIGPLVDEETRKWLQEATAAIQP